MVAIIPAAGLGKRMNSVTGGAPKEMLQIAGKRVIQWAVHEAVFAGSHRIIVVSSELKPDLNLLIEGLDDRVELAFQDEPRGLAHAVASAGITDEAALVLMGDSIFRPSSPLDRIKAGLDEGAWAAVAVRQIPREQIPMYGIVEFDPATHAFGSIVEKPRIEEAAGDWAVSGRYGFSADAMAMMSHVVGSSREINEINLTMVLQSGLKLGKEIRAVPLLANEKLFDCGDPEGYRMAQEELGR